jgi:hypothetical protein
VASLGAIFGATCLHSPLPETCAGLIRLPIWEAALRRRVPGCFGLAPGREPVVVASELTLERKDFDLTRDFAVA